MCKFQQPQIPANVTADERRAIYFDALYSLDLSDKVEKYNDLTYLSWANAWAEFKRCYPSATYRIIKNPETNLPYFADPCIGIMVYTEVEVEGITHEMWLPVMNSSNKAMKLEAYTYSVYDKFKKQHVEKTVEAATMFDINKTIMRCLVKNLAMFGLGLYIYAGEDVPENDSTDTQQTDSSKKTTRRAKTINQAQQVTDKYAGIKAALNACLDQQSLMSLYQQHKNEVDSNSEIITTSKSGMIMKTKRIELKESGVLFNEEEHSYWLGNKELSGITGMLQRQLFPDEFDGIPKHLIQGAADYGAGVHLSCEDFDKNWINDGTQEVIDYIQLCKDYGLVHECSEYTVTDGANWASKIDKVYRVSEDTFSLGDIKTYGQMTPVKLEKVRWQLSIYAYFFELMNRKAKIDQLFIIRLRNKMKKDGSFDHIKEIIFVNRIPSDVCKELLDCDLRGERFINPFDIPDEYRSQEETIRNLIQAKAVIEEQLANIKAKILADMEAQGVKIWATETMRLIRKSPTTRSSFNLPAFKSDHPELEYESYMKVSPVAGSLQIVV